MSSEEKRRLQENLEEYDYGAARLVDPTDGDIETFVKDSNWPGATSCALSHLRALVSAAVQGYEHVLVFEDDAVISAPVARRRGWCDSCHGEVCFCAGAWAACVEDAFELMRNTPSMDLLYLGLGEEFEPAERIDGLLADDRGRSNWLSALLGQSSDGVTQIGYTWCAQAIGYSRSALNDVLSLRLWELLWAQDETIPHLYGRKPWNDRFVKALREAGWSRRWVAGAPSELFREPFECLRSQGWVLQLEMVSNVDEKLFGTAAESSNSKEF